MKKVEAHLKNEKSREWRQEKEEAQDPIEKVPTGTSAEFMDRVHRQLKAIKNFKAAYVRG
ncbi:MAG: hypothetical protein AAGN35_07235 [Bacteroidota bacterium]